MRNMVRRITAMLLFIALAVTMVPLTALATIYGEWFEYTSPSNLRAQVEADLGSIGETGNYAYVTKLRISGTLVPTDYAFIRSSLTGLVELDLSGFTGTFEDGAFTWANFTKVRLPAGVPISDRMFQSCGNLTTLVCGSGPFTDGLIDLSAYPAASYGANAFALSAITRARLPADVPISERMFSNCRNLTTLVCGGGPLTDGLLDLSAYTATSYGVYAFGACAFTRARLPAGVPVSNGMFSSCTNLTTLVCGGGSFTDGVLDLSAYTATNYGDAAFQNIGLTRARLPAGVPISERMFCECLYLTTLVCGGGSFTNGVIDLSAYAAAAYGDLAFAFAGLTRARLPAGVPISAGMFQKCNRLTTLVCGGGPFTDGVIDLSAYMAAAYGDLAFYGSAITRARLLAGVPISESMFGDCARLSTLYFLGGNAPSLGADAFLGVPNTGDLYHPAGAGGYGSGVFATPALDNWTRHTSGPAPSDKNITGFAIGGVGGVIDQGAQTITVTLPHGTDVRNLTPTITHTGASVNPASGAGQDFTNPVTYTVTAQDGSTKTYTAAVRLRHASQGVPKTGDGFPMATLLSLLAVGLAGLCWLGFRRMRRS